MSDTVNKKVLLMGFKSDVALPPYFRELFGTDEEIGAKIRADHDRIRRAGITTVTHLINSRELGKGLKDVESLLHEGSYDAIGIGAGVRLVPEYSELFERLVNMCIKNAPGVPLMFNDGPDGSTRVVERVLGLHIP